MSLSELEIIERTAQLKCGSDYIVALDPLKTVNNESSILIRLIDKEDTDIIIPCVLPSDSSLREVCEMVEALVEDLSTLTDM